MLDKYYMKGCLETLHFSSDVEYVLGAPQGWRRRRDWMIVECVMEKMNALAVIVLLTLEKFWTNVGCV